LAEIVAMDAINTAIGSNRALKSLTNMAPPGVLSLRRHLYM